MRRFGRGPGEYDAERSSVAVGGAGGGRSPLLPLLLAIGLVVLLAILIPIVSCGDDDEGSGGDGGVSSAERGSGGSLVSEGASLLGGGAPGLREHVGEPARARGVVVLSTTKAGFFVGTRDSDRQYVEYSSRIGEGEPAQLPKARTRVDFDAEVRPAPEDPGRTLLLGPTEADTVEERGAFLNAEVVTPAR